MADLAKSQRGAGSDQRWSGLDLRGARSAPGGVALGQRGDALVFPLGHIRPARGWLRPAQVCPSPALGWNGPEVGRARPEAKWGAPQRRAELAPRGAEVNLGGSHPAQRSARAPRETAEPASRRSDADERSVERGGWWESMAASRAERTGRRYPGRPLNLPAPPTRRTPRMPAG